MYAAGRIGGDHTVLPSPVRRGQREDTQVTMVTTVVVYKKNKVTFFSLISIIFSGIALERMKQLQGLRGIS